MIDNWYAVDDADFPLWRLQVMSALKHALARGAVLAGTSMRPVFPNRAGSATPDYYATPPDPTDMPPGPLPQTMPTSTAEASVEQQLPLWAKTAQVDVSDWAGGERRVSAAMTVAPIELMQLNPQEVVLYLLDQQLSLNANGANIGSVVLRIGSRSESRCSRSRGMQQGPVLHVGESACARIRSWSPRGNDRSDRD